jgi:RES domain-containing protein
MALLWRLYRGQHGPGLDGIGGTFAEGRWHPQGELIVYFGASAAIVVLERLAHTNPDLFPNDLQLGQFEFPDSSSIIDVTTLSALPKNWVQKETVTRRIGKKWLRSELSPLLAIPSVILPEETNYIFNPRHTAARSLKLLRQRPFMFDPRLI